MIKITSIIIFLLSFFSIVQADKMTPDYIVLLHGIGRSDFSMRKLETYFSNKGYEVINIDYPSRSFSIKKLSEKIYTQLDEILKDPSRKVHFVTHSMGGLVVRALSESYKPDNIGRVVMLGGPNHGSEVADLLKNNVFYKYFYGPAGTQLTSGPSSFSNKLPEPSFELGVIAGNRTIDPISSYIIKGPDDGKVSVKSTKLKGMKDHITLNVTHTFMTSNFEVIHQASYFIENGLFDHSKEGT